MDCMQYGKTTPWNVQGQFQYRKRYGLHAIVRRRTNDARERVSIPQAVWIACNSERIGVVDEQLVSIPQAVWIACNGEILVADFAMNGFNTASGMDCMQYEKDH